MINFILLFLTTCVRFQVILSNFDNRPTSVTQELNLNLPSGFVKLAILNFTELVNLHGYPVEEHHLKTIDGYELRFHRIPGSPINSKAIGKPVVYIQHGILASSDMFVLAGPGKDLAFILADAGFDVWLGNGRGNTYSKSHVNLTIDDPQFWKFSFHEIALYDTSATIDYVLNETQQKTLSYVAHSMGSTIGLILLSEKPEYNEKINVVVNMATIGNWKKPRNIMKFFSIYGHYVKAALYAAGINEILPQSLELGTFLHESCRNGSILQPICLMVTSYICGYDPDQLDTSLLSYGLAYFPAGTSTQTLYHYYQNIKAGKLQKFDYGLIGNFAAYKQFTPPIYNLKNVVTPVILIYGKGDTIAGPEDSMDLIKVLPNAKAETVMHDKFNHLDFVWSKNVNTLLHNRVFKIIQRSLVTKKIQNL